MTEGHQIAFTQAFAKWFKGNQSAMRFCADVVEVSHVWDDLVDKDKPVSSEDANAAFRKMILEIPANDFYRANFGFLHPVMIVIWAQWDASNKMEAHPIKDDVVKTFMLRASLYQLFHACAVLCGGLDWASEIGPEIYRLYGEKLESLDA
jgi:hypothetical protein